MNTKLLLSGVLAVLAAGSIAQSRPYRPFTYRLLPTANMQYSVAFAINSSATIAVGVSSDQQIVINDDEEITPSSGQTLVPTTWSLTGVPTGLGPYTVQGQAFTGLGTANAALYGECSGAYSGTRFNADNSTTGFIYWHSILYPFTTEGSSYGYGCNYVNNDSNPEAIAAAGWVGTSTDHRACCYFAQHTNRTLGLWLLGTTGSGYSGSGFKISSPANTVGNYFGFAISGTDAGNAVYWTAVYGPGDNDPAITLHSIPQSPSTPGAAYGLNNNFDPVNNTFNTNYAVGTDTGANPDLSFRYSYVNGVGSFAETIPGIGYGVSNNGVYVGVTSGAAYVSSQYATYGTLYNWLNGLNWSGQNAYGISDFTGLQAAYDVVYMNSTTNYFAVGAGSAYLNGTVTPQMAFVAVFH